MSTRQPYSALNSAPAQLMGGFGSSSPARTDFMNTASPQQMASSRYGGLQTSSPARQLSSFASALGVSSPAASALASNASLPAQAISSSNDPTSCAGCADVTVGDAKRPIRVDVGQGKYKQVITYQYVGEGLGDYDDPKGPPMPVAVIVAIVLSLMLLAAAVLWAVGIHADLPKGGPTAQESVVHPAQAFKAMKDGAAALVQSAPSTPSTPLTTPAPHKEFNFAMTIAGIDYNSLVSNSSLEREVANACADTVAGHVGTAVKASDVRVKFSVGSVVANLFVTVPHSASPEYMASWVVETLNDGIVGHELVARLYQIPHIASVLSGSVQVTSFTGPTLMGSQGVPISTSIISPDQISQGTTYSSVPTPYASSTQETPPSATVSQMVTTSRPKPSHSPAPGPPPTAAASSSSQAAQVTTTKPAAEPSATYDCNSEEFEKGDRVQAGVDIWFRPEGAGMVPRSTYGSIMAGPEVASPGDTVHDFTVDFDGFPKLEGARVSRLQLVQALKSRDRVEAAANLGSGSTGIPEGAKGVIGEVKLPGPDEWEVLYKVQWSGRGLDVSSQWFTRTQLIKIQDMSASKKEYCCRTAKIGCSGPSATESDKAISAREQANSSRSDSDDSGHKHNDPSICYDGGNLSDDAKDFCCRTQNVGCPDEDDGSITRHFRRSTT